jgi:hypothetical protein
LRTLTILFLVLGLSTSAGADDQNSPEIQTLMTPEDFTEAGLDKLSDSERAHLSEWVARYREGAIKGPPVPGKSSTEVAQEPTPDVTAEPAQETTQEYPGDYRTEKEKTKEKNSNVKYELVAKVIPAFRGWSGKSVFRLDNGQMWQQRTPGKLRYSGTDSTVTITQNVIGKFKMKHQGTGRSVGVKRVD